MVGRQDNSNVTHGACTWFGVIFLAWNSAHSPTSLVASYHWCRIRPTVWQMRWVSFFVPSAAHLPNLWSVHFVTHFRLVYVSCGRSANVLVFLLQQGPFLWIYFFGQYPCVQNVVFQGLPVSMYGCFEPEALKYQNMEHSSFSRSGTIGGSNSALLKLTSSDVQLLFRDWSIEPCQGQLHGWDWSLRFE